MTVHLLCHVERLPKYEASGDAAYFSMNLTVAFDSDPGSTPDRKFLSPWNWKIDTIDAHREKGGRIVGKLDVALLSDKADASSPFARKLDTILDGFIANKDARTFVWTPGDETLERDGSKLRWHDYLIHVSTYPPALSQKGGITMVFRVSELGDADRIVAAPRIDFGDGVRTPLDPTPDLADGANPLHYVRVGSAGPHEPPFFYEWRYDHDVVAYQRECLLAPPQANDQFLDLGSGWVTPAGEATTPEEWDLQLESRMTEAFDLPLRMIEALRDGVPITDANRKAIVESVLAAMHDIAGTGSLRSTAPRVALDVVTRLLADLDTSHGDAIRAKLEQYEKNLTLERWTVLLATVIKTEIVDAKRLYENRVLDELLRIHGLLCDEEILRALVLAQWRDAVASDAALVTEVDRVRDRLLRDILPRYNLRKLFLTDVLQEVWPSLSDLDMAATRAEQVQAIQKSSKAALETYLQERLASMASKRSYLHFQPQDFTPSGELAKATASRIDAYVATFADKVVPAERSGDQGRDALLIQVADVTRTKVDATGEADQGDSSRRISGYGVLLRQGSAGPWSCLNLAHVHADDGTELARAVPVPVRLGFRNGVRQSFVAYENTPLTAESPFIAPIAARRPLEDQISKSATEPLFQYRNPYGPAADQPRLVPLVYGDDYEAAAFAIGTAGSLPAGLAKKRSDGTGMFEPTVIDLPNAKPEGVRVLKFRRRQPVGLPRLFDPKTAKPFATLPLPQIPRTVLPIARSLADIPSDRADAEADPRPLLLLRTSEPAYASFQFALRPPSVDIHTWDRWISKTRANPATKGKRIAVWRAYHEGADTGGATLRPGAERIDLSLDDPAVSGWIARLTRRFPGPEDTKISSVEKLVDAVVQDPLDIARSRPLEVSIQSQSVDTAAVTLTSAVCQIIVPAGQVWTVEIFPVVDSEDVRTRFAPDVEGTQTVGGKTVFQPFALDVEATPAKIEIPGTELFAALQVAAENDDNELVLSIDGTKLTTSQPWIHRLELVVQQWRWSGRPIVRAVLGDDGKVVLHDGFLPLLKGGKPTLPNENDDAILFADRSPIDALILPSFVDFVALKPPTPPQPPTPLKLHRRDVSVTKGALYFRVALRAFSRYEGLPGLDVSGDSSKAASPDAWKRQLLRCRWTDPVPVPVVKMVVPLTRPMGDQKTPALLVVLDEPWGDTGGLAETFVAEITSVRRTDHPGVESQLKDIPSLPELGPDPLLSVRRNESTVAPRNVIGPIGYTFDTDTDAPLFVKSSFLVPPPDGIADLSWYFVKLQFARALEPAWTVDNRRRQSDFTSPAWAQYLPSSTRFGDIEVGGLTLRIDAQSQTGDFVRDGHTAKPIPTKPDVGASVRFELHVILTDRVEDASGRPDQEMFLEIVPLRADGTFPVTKSAASPRARIIEVQRRGNATGSLWDDLFVKDPRLDAKARIVRVSPPISSRKDNA